MNRILIVIIFLACFTVNINAQDKDNKLLENQISPPTGFIQQPFDIQHYSAFLDMRAAPTTYMEGKCDIHVNWIGDPDTSKFFFHLRGLTIDSIFYQNIRIEHTTIGTKEDVAYYHEIIPPSGEAGDNVIITVYYHGEMTPEDIISSRTWGGVHRYADLIYALGVGIQNSYVATTKHWLPCYDHPSDKATFRAEFLVPKGMTVASIGTVEIIEGEDYDTHIWTHDHPCATYLNTFAVGYLNKLDFYGADIPVNVYAWDSDTAAARFHFERVPRMVNFYESIYGDYPFEKVGYVITPKGSMEHQTMISMARSLVLHEYMAEDTMTTTTAHELSHMWFGDMVTCLDFSDAWLNEGFATFSEALWLEHLVGRDAYLQQLEGDIGAYIQMISVAEGVFPLHNFKRTPPSSNYPGTIYDKGAVVLGMLRTLIKNARGDEQFFDALAFYLNKHKYGNVTTEDLKNDLESYLDLNLDFFFDQWVYGKGWPKLKIDISKIYNDDKLDYADIMVQQIQPEEYGFYEMLPISFIFIDDYGKATEYLRIMYQGIEYFTFPNLNDFNEVLINQGDFRTLLEVEELNYVGVNDIPDLDFSVYPNPASSFVNIFLDDVYGNMELTIVDILGKVVFTKTIINPIGKINEQVNLDNIETGLYYIVLDSKGLKKTQPLKVIK